MVDEYTPGTLCIINNQGDAYMEYEAWRFIGCRCVIVRRTKAGLIEVVLEEDTRKRHTFPQRNVDILAGV